MSITFTGFCKVTEQYQEFTIAGGPVSWGSDGSCAWCDQSTQTVYVNVTNPTGYSFTCDSHGDPNSIGCVSVSSCSQSGPGYQLSISSALSTVSYVGGVYNGPGCAGFHCSTVEYVTTTVLVPANGGSTTTPSTAKATTSAAAGASVASSVRSASAVSNPSSSAKAVASPATSAIASVTHASSSAAASASASAPASTQKSSGSSRVISFGRLAMTGAIGALLVSTLIA